MARFFRTVCIVIAAAALAGSAQAAVQGSLGTTSTGTLNFSVTKPARADITSLSDLSLTGWMAGDGDVTLTEDVCIYSTRPSGGYTVLASGSGTGGIFTLSNGASNLPYSVTWNSGGVGSLSNSGLSLAANMVSSALYNAATTSSTCNGSMPGPTARLIVGITSGDMSSAPFGAYSGTLTLTITPN